MRFFRNSRNYRIWGSVLWGLLLCVWLPIAWAQSARHPWRPWIWIVLTLIQFASLWTYWEITATELIGVSFGFRSRYLLSAIEGIGPPATHRRLLRNTLRADYRGRRTLFITVADKSAFEQALRRAVAAADQVPSSNGPLGLPV